MERVIIEKPFLVETADKARLVSTVEYGCTKKELFYEVDKEYLEYLCFERCDAFLLALLPFCMINNCDLECKTPISEKLYYQLTSYYMPTLANNDPQLYHMINIIAQIEGTVIQNKQAVVTAVSGGVDSSFTIEKNLKLFQKSFELTHLTIVNSFNIYYGEEDTRQRFDKTKESAQRIADDYGLPLISIYSNIYDFWFYRYVNIYCLRYISYAYALQKLISVFYYATAFRYDEFTFSAENHSDAHFDCFTAQLLSNENLTVYSSGGEVERLSKVERIADNPVVQKHLQVCNISRKNCSICPKCMRTEMELYALNKLNAFSEVFDLELFEKEKNHEISQMIMRKNVWDRETLNKMRDNAIPIPIFVKFKGIMLRLLYLFKSFIKRIGIFRHLYITMHSKKLTNIFNDWDKSERYNVDPKYAKQCNPDIIDFYSKNQN